MNKASPGSAQDAELVRALVQAQDLCARLEAERSTAKREAEAARSRATELEESIAFRLGSLLLSARSIKGLLGAPRELARLVRHWKTRGHRGGPTGTATAPSFAELPGADIVRAWHASRRPAPPERLSGLRVAAVVDEFTEACFAPDCQLLNLPVTEMERHLDEFQPHLLFVESAWRGRDGDWMHKVHPCSGELRRLVDACRRRAVPTVFWSKEDPSHFENFIEAAALFDHVFTTDADCVPRYRERLGHDRVDVLGFACQPAIHNPVEERARRKAASFAGSWYAKYPDRARDFEALADAVQKVMPLEIYDRNHERSDPAFAYPEKYHSLIKGGVPYERIADVYKGCEFAITVNTITGSPTMFARRVFELLACNTITVSNYSAGLDRMFGDIVVMAGRDDVSGRLRQLAYSQLERRRLRMRGLREVMRHHTAARRLEQITRAVLGPVTAEEPCVWVVAQARNGDELARVLDMFQAQLWQRKELLLVASEDLARAGSSKLVRDARFVDGTDKVESLVPEEDWLAQWHPDDYYGPCYLLDLMHASRFWDGMLIGKSSWFRMAACGPMLQDGDDPYHETGDLSPRRSIGKGGLVAQVGFRQSATASAWPSGTKGLAVAEFGYCMDGGGSPGAAVVDV